MRTIRTRTSIRRRALFAATAALRKWEGLNPWPDHPDAASPAARNGAASVGLLEGTAGVPEPSGTGRYRAAMSFRWDWLKPVAPVPYVPTLGPVHPLTLDAGLFEDVVSVAGTGQFLPYDKSRRWSDVKEETVLVDAIEHCPSRTLIPTVDRRGTGRLTVIAYGCRVDAKVVERAFKLAAASDAATARVLAFRGPDGRPAKDIFSVRVWLGDVTSSPPDLLQSPAVEPLDNLRDQVRATFASFVDRLDSAGFSFLHRHMQAADVGPVLVATCAGRVIGAIGPMETIRDSVGAVRLLPPYFGVLPEHRGKGHGRALWRAAMEWARGSGAGYLILQAETGSPSDRLYQSEGLCSLGYVCGEDL